MVTEMTPVPKNGRFTDMINSAFEAHSPDVVYGLNGERSLTLQLPTVLLSRLSIPSGLSKNFPGLTSDQMYMTFTQGIGSRTEEFSGVRIEVFDKDHSDEDSAWKMELKVRPDDSIISVPNPHLAQQSINLPEFGDVPIIGGVESSTFITKELLRLVNFEHYRNKIRLMLKDKVSASEIERIENAFLIADIHHRGQFRDSGEPYIDHVFEAARILVEECEIYDVDVISATFAHDVLEDSGEWRQKNGENFFEWLPGAESELASAIGEEAASLVGRVTRPRPDEVEKPGMIMIFSNEHANFIYKARIEKDPRAILIKMADRLHNLRTLSHLPLKRQINTILETVSYFSMFEALLDDVDYSEAASKMLNDMWKIMRPSIDTYLNNFEDPDIQVPYWVKN